jgi:hypothetical protein
VPIVDASPQDLCDALLRLRSRYLELEESRRWYSALVCAVLVKDGRLPEWTDWMLEPPPGAAIEMTPAVDSVIASLFGTQTQALLRNIPNGVVPFLNHPERVIVDPLRRPGRATTTDSLCVVVNGFRYDVPISDPSWLWNDGTEPLTAGGYGNNPPQMKHSNDYGAQQGILCHLPADSLFALGPEAAAAAMATPRHDCPHWAVRALPRRREADEVGNPPSQPTASCDITNMQCASKGSGVAGPGGPRALIPDTTGSSRRLLAPGSFDRILDDANPNGVLLPSSADMALVLDYLAKAAGKALDANRLHQLIAPQHFAVLFEP